MKRTYQGAYTYTSPPPVQPPVRPYYPRCNNPSNYNRIITGLPPALSGPTNNRGGYYRPYSPRAQWHPQMGPPLEMNRRWSNVPSVPRTTASYVPPRKKSKKKPMSQSVPAKVIDINDAIEALKCENELSAASRQLIIRFPDPPLDREMVLSFNSAIKKVHFQQPSTPRYCFVQLEEGANVDRIMADLRKVSFGQGFLKVELKHETNERRDRPEDIDPYILFVGNIGQNTPAETIKGLFHPGRVDIGPSQKIKNSRYAYVRFTEARDAITILRKTHGAMVGDHSLNVRFRRLNGSVGLPGDTKATAKKVASPPAATTPVVNTPSVDPESPLTPVCIKKEELDLYMEQPEQGDEIDIKVEQGFFCDNAAYYDEHPESDNEFDNDFLYSDDLNRGSSSYRSPCSYTSDFGSESSRHSFSDIGSNGHNTSEPRDVNSERLLENGDNRRNGHFGDHGNDDFVTQLQTLNASKFTADATSTRDLGHSVRQIRLPARQFTNDITSFSREPTPQELRLKSEIDDGNFEVEEKEASEFADQVRQISMNVIQSTPPPRWNITSGDGATCSYSSTANNRSAPRPNAGVKDDEPFSEGGRSVDDEKSSIDIVEHKVADVKNEMPVRIPMSRLHIAGAFLHTRREPGTSRDDGDEKYEDAGAFANDLKALLKKPMC